jgi:predicted metal-dependent hydrolase
MSVKFEDKKLGEALYGYISGTVNDLTSELRDRDKLAMAIVYVQKKYDLSPRQIVEALRKRKEKKPLSIADYERLAKRILEEYKEKLGIDHDVKLLIRPYKWKPAFAELVSKKIYLNKYFLLLGEDVIRYLILHELVHIKLNNPYHNDMFYETFYSYMPSEKARYIQELLVKWQFYLATGKMPDRN